MAGGAGGLLVSLWISSALVRFATVDLPITTATSSNMRVLAFTAGLAMLTALLFGTFPALQASRVDVNAGLREGGRGQTLGPKRIRMLDTLVIGQFALALILLISAGLLARSFSRLIATNP